MTHGTLRRYVHGGCRCRRCRDANADHQRRLRARRSKAGTCLDCTRLAVSGRRRCKAHLALKSVLARVYRDNRRHAHSVSPEER